MARHAESMTPPHDSQAEQAVIGSVLQGADLPDLKASDFFIPWCSKAFAAMVELSVEGAPMDPVLVRDRSAVEAPLLIEAQKHGYASRVTEYAEVVREKSRLRAVIYSATEIITNTHESDADEAESFALSAVMSLADGVGSGTVTGDEAALQYARMASLGGIDYIHPPCMRDVLITKGDVVMFGADTGLGKTSIVCWWVDEWSREYKTLFVEYEMSPAQVYAKMAARESKVGMFDVIRGVDGEQMQAVLDACGRKRPLLEFATGLPDAPRLLARLRRFAAAGGRIAVIDHVGLVHIDIPRGMNEYSAMKSVLMDPLKRVAEDTGLRIICVSQISKDASKRGRDHKYPWPSTADLIGTSGKEHNSSVVIMAHKWPAHDEEQGTKIRQKLGILPEDDRALIRLGVEKNRWGSCHHIHVLADLRTNEFERVGF